MKKLLMLAATAFVMTGAIPVFAEDAATATAPAAETSKEAPKDGKPFKGRGGMFERGDTNGDGVVTKEEFLAQSEETFKALDTDGDSKITKAELEEKRKKMRELYAQRKKQKEGKPASGSDTPVEGKSE
jgi:hypothetical protein